MGIFVPEISGKVWTGLFWRRVGIPKFGLMRTRRSVDFSYRTTLVKLDDGTLWVSTPGGPFNDKIREEIRSYGKVGHVVAPGTYSTYHFLTHWKEEFPDAKFYSCPGVEEKFPQMNFDSQLDVAGVNKAWEHQIDQMFFEGTRAQEFVFFHRKTRALIVPNLVQRYTQVSFVEDRTLTLPLVLYLSLTGGIGVPKMSPCFNLPFVQNFKDVQDTKEKMQKIIKDWRPEGLIMCKGENVWGAEKVKSCLEEAWKKVLKA